MTRSIPPGQGNKDAQGAYLPVDPPPSDIDLASVLDRQLLTLWRVTQQLAKDSARGLTRDEIQSLATCIKITMELKAKENELLDRMNVEELQRLSEDTPDATE